jgi:thermitase
MTTDEARYGPVGPLEAPFWPERDYPDNRSYEQLREDQQTTQQQLEAFESHARLDQIIARMQRRQNSAPAEYALPFDKYRRPGIEGAHGYVLVVRGELVVSVPAEEGPQDVTGPTGKGEPDVRALLAELRYDAVPDAADERLRLPSRQRRTFVFRSAKSPEQLAEDVETLRRQGVEAAMHLVVPLGHIIKSDDYPKTTEGRGSYPPPSAQTTEPTRRRVRVAVIDTGITPEDRTDDWLDAVARGAANQELLDVLPVTSERIGDGRLDWHAGHGSFTAGVVQQVAPYAEIVAYRFTRSDGLGTETDVANAMIQAAEEAAGVPLIINASLGTPAVGDVPPLALRDAVQLIRDRYPDVLIVASAGNNGDTERMYPAGFDTVIAVGALTKDLQPAPFSNRGPWLLCSTIGVGVVSTFVEGTEPPEEDPNVADYSFPANAWAVWSGTSFSAPQISGAVARLMQENPALATPRAALDALLAGQPQLQGFGRILRLLPGTPAVRPVP